MATKKDKAARSDEYQQYLASEQWARLREEAVGRASGQCERCGIAASLEVHHWRYPDDLKDDSAENLVVFCAWCHRAVHANKRATSRDSYLREIAEDYETIGADLGDEAHERGFLDGEQSAAGTLLDIMHELVTEHKPITLVIQSRPGVRPDAMLAGLLRVFMGATVSVVKEG